MTLSGGTATSVIALTNASANTFSGGATIGTGIVRVTNSNQLGTGPLIMLGTLQAAADLTFSTPPQLFSASTIDTQGFNVFLNGGLGGSGGSGGTTTTTIALTKAGAGALTFGGTSTFAGTWTIGALGGTVNLNGSGRMPELGAVTVGRSGALNLDNSITNLTDRVGRSTNLTLSNNGTAGGATVNLTTNASGSTFSFGTLSVTGGVSGNANSSTINVIDGGAGTNTVRFTSLTAVAANNTLNFVGTTNLGLASAGGSRIFFTTPPTLSGGIIPNATFTGFGGTGSATYDSVLGVIYYSQTAGTFIDNITNVGPGSITASDTNFLTNGATTANLGAYVKSLTAAGHTVTLTPGVNAPQAGNNNAPANTLILSAGNLTSTTNPSTLTSAAASVVQFGATGTTTANITTTTNLTIDPNVTLSTSGGLVKSGAGTLTFGTTNSITGAYDLSGGQTILPSSGTTVASLTNSGALNLNGGTLTFSNGSATTTFSGAITGVAGSAISTTGTFTGVQTLSGGNSQIGAIIIGGGTLVAGNATALGNAANAVTVSSGATLGFNTSVIANTNPVSIVGVGATGRNGAIDNILGTSSFAGPITLTGNATIGATAGTLTLSGGLGGAGIPSFNVATGATVTLSTVALNIGTNALSKSGGGSLNLPNLANTLGNVTVTGGLVQATADNNLGATSNSMTLNGGGFRYGATFTLDPARSIALGAAHGTIDTNTFSPTLGIGLTGAGNLTKAGTGTLTLTAASSYGGTTTVTSGTLTLGVANALPTTTALTLGDASLSNAVGLFAMGGFNQTVAGLTLVAPSGSTTRLTGIGTLTINGNVAYVNNAVDPNNDFPVTIGTSGSTVFDLGGAVRNFTTVANANTNDLVVAGVIQNGGVNYTGTSAIGSASGMQFTAANTFNGGLTVNGGVLNVSATGTLGATTNAVTIQATGTAGVGTNATINTLSAQTIGSLSGGTVSGTAVATLALGGNLTINQAAGTATYGGTITGSGFTLTKSGGGTTNLTGANTYTGLTTVSGGVLSVNNTNASATGTGNVLVSAGGTLGGGNLAGTAGFIVPAASGNVTIDGTIAPGNSVGTITLGSATTPTTLNLNGTLTAEVAHPDADRIVVFGNLNLGASSVLNLLGTNTYDASTTYTLVSFTGTRTGTFASVTGMPVTHAIDYSGVNTVVLIPVPEPGTILGLSAIGLGLLTYGRRRLRREPVLAVAA